MRPPPASIHVFFSRVLLLSPHLSPLLLLLLSRPRLDSLISVLTSLSLSPSSLATIHQLAPWPAPTAQLHHRPNHQCRRAVPSLRLQACSSCCSCRLAIIPTAPATLLCSHTLVSVSLLIRLIPLLQSEPAARPLARASASLVGLVIRLLLI
ncbi:hypothetical protein IWX90DRAFT_182788 [Phyllosticta citrichinensis]|uniref:Uncharacterized protein n=1 Tax=Phyllosticta citrichinensis TaxID=1130410 RepID=A0ABR1XVY6_9PEZI